MSDIPDDTYMYEKPRVNYMYDGARIIHDEPGVIYDEPGAIHVHVADDTPDDGEYIVPVADVAAEQYER